MMGAMNQVIGKRFIETTALWQGYFYFFDR